METNTINSQDTPSVRTTRSSAIRQPTGKPTTTMQTNSDNEDTPPRTTRSGAIRQNAGKPTQGQQVTYPKSSAGDHNARGATTTRGKK